MGVLVSLVFFVDGLMVYVNGCDYWLWVFNVVDGKVKWLVFLGFLV